MLRHVLARPLLFKPAARCAPRFFSSPEHMKKTRNNAKHSESASEVRTRLLSQASSLYSSPGLQPSMDAGDFLQSYLLLSPGQSLPSQDVRQTGRVVGKREVGAKLIFFDIISQGHDIQLKASRTQFDSDEQFAVCRGVSRGDIISAQGFPSVSRQGQLSLCVRSLTLLAPCLHPIPECVQDPELLARNRHLDLLVNQGVKERFILRSKVIRQIRKFFDDRRFIEVETPILWPTAGGANAAPFVTKGKAHGDHLELRIAPELFLKQLIVGGFDRVYELGKVFRNEGVDRNHHPEFTSCEFYMANTDYRELFALTEQFFTEICSSILPADIKFKRVDVVPALQEALTKRCGREIDMMSLLHEDAAPQLQSLLEEVKLNVPTPATAARMLDTLISELVEPDDVEPTFLVHHPTILSPLAKACPDQPLLAERFELFIGGSEVCNAYSELNDPEEQRRRFELQQRGREGGDPEAQRHNDEYCRVLEYGLPPTAGWGIGVDRLVMLLSRSDSIRDVLLYPIVRKQQEESP